MASRPFAMQSTIRLFLLALAPLLADVVPTF
jgi:hypothetical protein